LDGGQPFSTFFSPKPLINTLSTFIISSHHHLTFSPPHSPPSPSFYNNNVVFHPWPFIERGLFENLKISRGFFELILPHDLGFTVCVFSKILFISFSGGFF